MVMAALTQFLLGPRSAQFFNSIRELHAQNLAWFPLSQLALSSSEACSIRSFLPHWPQPLRDRISVAIGVPGLAGDAKFAA
jgi:hypothetical protein